MGTILLRFLLGGVAGFLAWLIWEPSYPKGLSTGNDVEAKMVMTAGLMIGAVIAGLSGYSQGGKRHTLRGLGLGALFGAVGIMFGYGIGSGFASSAFGPLIFVDPTVNGMTRMLARILVLTPVGAALGLAVGAATLNLKRTIQGVIGGVIAGAGSGFIFDPIASLAGAISLPLGQSETGTVSRALTFLLLGSMIGLFIGLVERVARSAWLRLNLGRNEGKEWSIDSAQTFIGRSEGAHIPLFGDMNVAPIHASIQKQGGQYILIDGGSPVGTYLNGHRIQQAILVPGSTIQIGGHLLTFLTKNSPAPVRGPEAYVGQPYGQTGYGPGGPSGNPYGATPMPMQTVAMPHSVVQQPAGTTPHPGQPAHNNPAQSGMPTQAMAPVPSMSGYALVALDGPLMGQRFPIQAPTDVGREAPGIPLSFDHNASRRHARLTPGPLGLVIADLGSKNGTYVNGQPVSQATAAPGDSIKIGSTTFRIDPI